MSNWFCRRFGIFCPKPPTEPEPPEPPIDPEQPPPQQDWVQELLYYHNRDRGQQKLALDDNLMICAQDYAELMHQRRNMSHYLRGTVGDRATEAGYSWWLIGENIAYGYDSAARVYTGWFNSPGHRSNILDSRYRDVGFGESGTYWCAVFGQPQGAAGRATRTILGGGEQIMPEGVRAQTDPHVRALQ